MSNLNFRALIARYDAVFIKGEDICSSFIKTSKVGWASIVSHFLNHISTSSLYSFDDWLLNKEEYVLYAVGLELSKKGHIIEMSADEILLDEGDERSFSISIKELKAIINQWRQLLIDSPPGIGLHKVDGKITLTALYDIDISS